MKLPLRPSLAAFTLIQLLPFPLRGAQPADATGSTPLDDVIVSAALPRSQFEQAQSVSILTGQNLQLAAEPSLGQTLARVPGVSSSYFGPGASRPIIRGLDGDRIRVLQNGLNTIDASATSADHAVSFDVANVKSIEVVRGPATLMYGSNAIGGVVNALDGRIVEENLDHTLRGSMGTRYSSVDNGYLANFMLEGGDGPYAFHVEGFTRAAEDLSIPGQARSARYQGANPLPPGEREPADHLPGSNLRAEGISGGGSYIWDDGFFGFSVGAFHTNYASPAEEGVSIDMDQVRLDVKGAFEHPWALIKKIDYRFAYSTYEHTEFEGTEPGTIFRNKGFDGRVEVQHEKIGPFEGTLGFQSDRSHFSALGDEAFVPTVLTQSNSGFIFEELPLGKVRFQLGLRYDHITAASETNPLFGPGRQRTFDNLSGSLGLVYNPTEDYAIAFSMAYSERAPTYQELYANGPHVATGVFEVGDPAMGVESSIGLDLSLRKRTGWVTGSLSGYYNRFSNFIGQFPTGGTMVVGGDTYPIYAYRGIGADFLGAELEATVHLLRPVSKTPPEDGLSNLDLEFRADAVRARDRQTGDPLPRIPPFHLSTAVVYQKGPFSARLEGVYAAPQERVSPNELPTDSYFLVNAALTYTLTRGPLVFDFYLKGTNLTDAEAREHTSFLKDRVPLAGRGLVVGMKTSF